MERNRATSRRLHRPQPAGRGNSREKKEEKGGKVVFELLVLPAGEQGKEGHGQPGAICGEDRPGVAGATERRGVASFP